MSEIIRTIDNAGRFADIIETEAGGNYLVNSTKVLSWYETIIFNEADFTEIYKREYKTKKAMEAGHNNICQYAEMFIS